MAYEADNAISSALAEPDVKGVAHGVSIFSLGGDTRNWGHNPRPRGHGFQSVSQTGSGVTVGIIDSGIDCDHPDFMEYGHSMCAAGKSFLEGLSPYVDEYGHGTAVTSVVAARQNGFAVVGGARKGLFASYRVMSGSGSMPPMPQTCVTLAAAIDQATYDRRPVINISVGFHDTPENRMNCFNLQNAINFAWGSGILVVAAVGNTFVDCYDVCLPAAYDNVLAVSGLTRGYMGYVQFWSLSAQGPEVDLSAAANLIDVAVPVGGSYSYPDVEVYTEYGTSFAAPQVAAAAMLLIEKYPESAFHAAALEAHLKAHAYQSPFGSDPELYGAGVLDVVAALASNPCDAFGCDEIPPDPW